MTIESGKVITQLTREHLEGELVRLRVRLASIKSGNSDSQNNESFGDVQPQNDANAILGTIALYEQILDKTIVIPPTTTTEVAMVGNDVILSFPDETSNERFTLLGPVDTAYSPHKDRIMSNGSPTGAALVGRRKGSQVDVEIRESGSGIRQLRVKLVDILPGDETCFFPPKRLELDNL